MRRVIHCLALGPAQIEVAGRPAPPELLWRKHLALLVYLARSPRRTRTRDHLIGLLWSDKPEAAARHSLNEALRIIRRVAGDEAVATQGSQVSLAPGAVTLDLDQFEAAAQAGDLAAAASLVVGEFLEGLAVPGASGFEDWLTAERAHWTPRTSGLLATWSASLAERGHLDQAVAAAERAARLDPLGEAPALALLRALALRGDRAAALEREQSYRAAVRTQLGVEPSDRMRRLAERIRGERARPPALPAQPPAARDPRRGPLVGRDEELAGVLGVWAAARTGGPARVAAIDGESGVGKSRLAEEVAARARLDGAVVCTVRSVPADEAEAWNGLLALGRAGLLDATGVAAASPAALGAFARVLPDWEERFRDAVGQPEVSLGRAFTAVLEAIAGEQPVLLVVDDAEHLDQASFLSLTALPRDLPRAPLMVLMTIAPYPPRAELDELRAALARHGPGALTTLDRLDGAALSRLIGWAFPQYTEPEVARLARRLGQDSGGLPLLAVELLDALVHGLDLSRATAAWPEPFHTLDQSLPGDLPDAIIAAIRVGFHRLSPATRQVLAAASVLGDRVGSDLIARATELEPAQVTAALDELEWSRWLAAEPRGYSFLARITRDVIAGDMLTPGQRSRLLARVAG